MSYVDLHDKFEEVLNYHKAGGKVLLSVFQAFQVLREGTEQYAAQLTQVSQLLQRGLSGRRFTDTLSAAVLSLAEYFEQSAAGLRNNSTSVVQQLIQRISELLVLYGTEWHHRFARSSSLAKEIANAQTNVTRLRDKYRNAPVAPERLSENSNHQRLWCSDKSRAEARTRRAYQEAVEAFQRVHDNFEQELPSVMSELQSIEETAMACLKQELVEWTRGETNQMEERRTMLSDTDRVLNSIKPSTDIQVFIRQQQSHQPMNYDEFRVYEDALALHPFTDLAERAVRHFLFADLSMSEEELAGLTKTLQTTPGCQLFVNALNSWTGKRQLEPQCMDQLADYFNTVLTRMTSKDEVLFEVFLGTIRASENLYSVIDSKHVYLYSYLAPHRIWSQPAFWLQAIEYEVTKVIENWDSQKKNFCETIRNAARTVLNQDTEMVQYSRKQAEITISYFTSHLTHLAVPEEAAIDILLDAATQANLLPQATWRVLVEFKAKQPQDVSLSHWNFQDAPKPPEFYNFSLILDCFDATELLEVLLVCKKWLRWYREQVRERRLMLLAGTDRLKRWQTILIPGTPQLDYQELVEKSDMIEDKLQKIIDSDVARSYRSESEDFANSLCRVLRAFALASTQIKYCQGMNFIAGTLLWQFQDEVVTLRALIGLIRKFGMTGLLSESMPKVSLCFYQFDRLIAILLPEVHRSFRNAGVCAGHFSTSWFLTVFASPLHNKVEFLNQLWDLFFLKGWEVVFKAAILFLDQLGDSLVDKPFEEILNSINSIPNNEDLFTSDFFEALAFVPVTSQLLKQLEFEYFNLEIQANHNH